MNLNALLRKFPFLRYTIISIVINLVALATVLLSLKNLPPEIPLFYGLPEGASQLTKSANLLIPSGFAILITVLNSIIAVLVKNDFLTNVLVIASLAVSLFGTITTIKIFFLVANI